MLVVKKNVSISFLNPYIKQKKTYFATAKSKFYFYLIKELYFFKLIISFSLNAYVFRKSEKNIFSLLKRNVIFKNQHFALNSF